MHNSLKSTAKKVGIVYLYVITVAFSTRTFQKISRKRTASKLVVPEYRKFLVQTPDHQSIGNGFVPVLEGDFKRLVARVPNFKSRLFIDLGSGTGTGCLLALNLGAPAALGIELNGELVEIAQKATVTKNIVFLQTDAIRYILPELTTCVFFYNSFTSDNFEKFLLLNRDNLVRNHSILMCVNNLLGVIPEKYGGRILWEKSARTRLFVASSTLTLYKFELDSQASEE